MKGTIETLYATTCVGWHGQKALGFTITLDEKRRAVTMSAPDAVSQLAKDLLKDTATISPKHALTKELFDIDAGVMPDVGDPMRDEVNWSHGIDQTQSWRVHLVTKCLPCHHARNGCTVQKYGAFT